MVYSVELSWLFKDPSHTLLFIRIPQCIEDPAITPERLDFSNRSSLWVIGGDLRNGKFLYIWANWIFQKGYHTLLAEHMVSGKSDSIVTQPSRLAYEAGPSIRGEDKPVGVSTDKTHHIVLQKARVSEWSIDVESSRDSLLAARVEKNLWEPHIRARQLCTVVVNWRRSILYAHFWTH